MRSLSTIVRDDEDFGAAIWGPKMEFESPGAVMGELIAGRLPVLPDAESLSGTDHSLSRLQSSPCKIHVAVIMGA